VGLNIHFAAAWLRALTTSVDDALSFYAEDIEFTDAPQEIVIRRDKEALARNLRRLCNQDPANGVGIHKLEPLEYIGDQNSGLVLWRWSARHARVFFGLLTNGSAVETTGMSFHVYQNGKIRREIVYSDQIHVAQRLGWPIQSTLSGPPDQRTPGTRRNLRH
jgi:steroid delta-isomerase-like uncharacterized protein